ncbi:hypothetical protein BU16DRAFT_612360 [Lophium mytilinum]|uniref:Isochorismatase-like domain-containing protein n=1 Tax=Lophium mytilinum TaxID=390894 RepID=A0A6A6RH18_9PEZI|nr:hypothetical protein BU16DRAFT_612360 [Lophium mytilinum]
MQTQPITKNWYSAFTETGLHDWLQANGVGNGPLSFAGVTTNNCILATLTDAFFQRYLVRVIRECVGAVNKKSEVEAFKEIERYYGSTVRAESMIQSSSTDRVEEAEADVADPFSPA